MHSVYLPNQRTTAQPGIKPAVAPPEPVKPTPMNEWPAWTWLIMLARKPEDKGLGDTVVHLIGDTRSDRFKAWFKEKFGKSCGCAERQRWLNRKFPYDSTRLNTP